MILAQKDTKINGTEWRTQKQTHRPMLNYSMGKEPRLYTGEKTVSSISVVRKTVQLRVNG